MINNKDEIINNLILVNRRLKKTMYMALDEKKLKSVAMDIEDIKLKIYKLINEVDNTNY